MSRRADTHTQDLIPSGGMHKDAQPGRRSPIA